MKNAFIMYSVRKNNGETFPRFLAVLNRVIEHTTEHAQPMKKLLL